MARGKEWERVYLSTVPAQGLTSPPQVPSQKRDRYAPIRRVQRGRAKSNGRRTAVGEPRKGLSMNR